MNRSRHSLVVAGLFAAILGGLPMPMQRALAPRMFYKPQRERRSASESQQRIEAAQAKRARRCARNLALLRAEEARNLTA